MSGLFSEPSVKKILEVGEIEEQLEKKGKNINKISFLKGFLDDDYKDKRADIVRLLGPLLIHKDNSVENYSLTYDSFGEGVEPIYFWILDFMRDSPPGGLGLDVQKGPEEFEASVSSGYYGEMGQRTSLMQQKAVEYLGTINNLIKSILNLIYDLKEFEIKLSPYNDINNKDLSDEDKRAAMHSLKGVWMDQVDARKGRGSINLLAQDLAFVTLRDAFFYVNSSEEIAKLDLNLRVRNILDRKLTEFNAWLKFSDQEVRKRYEIEKTYLRSQIGTLKLYASWVKPYLIAAQKLKMSGNKKSDFLNPDIVNSFSNMQMDIKLYGKKEIKPSAVHDSYSDIKLDKKYFMVIEIDLRFRSVPSAMSGQGGRHYIHGGRTDIKFSGFIMDADELGVRESMELYEDINLIEEYVGVSLEQLQVEIDHYLKPEVKKDNKKEAVVKAPLSNPFGGLFKGFGEIINPLKETIFPKKKPYSFIYKELEDAAKSKAKKTTFVIYNTYKKTHGMVAV